MWEEAARASNIGKSLWFRVQWFRVQGFRASCLEFLEPHLLESEVAALQDKFC